MVQLGQTYKTEEIITLTGNNVWIKDGWHKGVIVSEELVDPLVSGKPKDVLWRVVVTDGEYKDTELEHRLSLFDETPVKADNPGFTWRKRALGFIAQIANAHDIKDWDDSRFVLNKPLMFETKTKEGKDKETGQPKPEWNRSQIYGYKAVSSLPAAPTHAATVAQQASAPQAPEAKPWAAPKS